MQKALKKLNKEKIKNNLYEMYPFKQCCVPGCNKETDLWCNRCRTCFYCSEAHQQHDWKWHKHICPIIRFVNSLKCRLSGELFYKPVKSKKCHHVYEEAYILQYIDDIDVSTCTPKCPYSSCSKDIFKKDLCDCTFTARLVKNFLLLLNYKGRPVVCKKIYDNFHNKFNQFFSPFFKFAPLQRSQDNPKRESNIHLRFNGKILDPATIMDKLGLSIGPTISTIFVNFKDEAPSECLNTLNDMCNKLHEKNVKLESRIFKLKGIDSPQGINLKNISNNSNKDETEDGLGRGEEKTSIISGYGYPYRVCRAAGCTQAADLCCNYCGIVFYCSPQHVKIDRKYHRQMCPIIRFVQCLKCPLTKTFIRKPMRSEKENCNHIFEFDAIYQFIMQNEGTAMCPYTKCDEFLTFGDLIEDDCFLRLTKLFLSLVELKWQYENREAKFPIKFGDALIFSRQNSHIASFLPPLKSINVHLIYTGCHTSLIDKQLIVNIDIDATIKDVILRFYEKLDLNLELIQEGYKTNFYENIISEKCFKSRIAIDVDAVLVRSGFEQKSQQRGKLSAEEIIEKYFVCRALGRKLDIGKTLKANRFHDGINMYINFIQDELYGNVVVELAESIKLLKKRKECLSENFKSLFLEGEDKNKVFTNKITDEYESTLNILRLRNTNSNKSLDEINQENMFLKKSISIKDKRITEIEAKVKELKEKIYKLKEKVKVGMDQTIKKNSFQAQNIFMSFDKIEVFDEDKIKGHKQHSSLFKYK